MNALYRLCWKAAAPDRSDKCPSPQRCWWRTCRWPEWWPPRMPCPDSSHRSEKRRDEDSERKDGTTNMAALQRPDFKDALSILYAVSDTNPWVVMSGNKRQTWNSLRIVEMLASLARLVRISNYKNHGEDRGSSEILSLINVQQICGMNSVWIKCVGNIFKKRIYE